MIQIFALLKLLINDLSIGSTETKYKKLNTKTQNIFCCVNENSATFLYTLTGGQENRRRKKFSFLKCIQKSNVVKKIIWVLVFSFMYLVSVDPMDRSLVNVPGHYLRKYGNLYNIYVI
jgi:hypothetical protein